MEQIESNNTNERGTIALQFDLGTFEGFNFKEDSAIARNLTAEEVVNWDHDAKGEAEFWPSGDNAGVAMLFKGQASVTCTELLDLDRVLLELGNDSFINYVRIHHEMNTQGTYLKDLTGEQVDCQDIHIFEGTSFMDLRKNAAYELFELFYPEAYKMWEACQCDGLIFDTDRFLDSPVWSVEEIQNGDVKALIVAPQ